MSDFKTIVLAMTEARPAAKAQTIVRLALAVEEALETHAGPPANLDDARALAAWAVKQPAVAKHIAVDKKINAIKELRALTGGSLFQTKTAMDLVFSGRVSS